MNSFNNLLKQINQFIKRYYYNEIVKGLAIFIFLFSSLFVVFSIIEYFGYLDSSIRISLLIMFILINASVLIKYIIIPTLALFKIGKYIDEYEAARILGKHFRNEIDDKILNTLQLKNILNIDDRNRDIIIAGIEQKSKKLLSYKFKNAIEIKKNLKYIPIVAIYIGVVGAGIYLIPEVFKEPALRIYKYQHHFEKPAPFQISLLNKEELRVFRGEDVNIDIKVEGSRLPADVFIKEDGRKFRMDKHSNNEFSYNFRNIRSDKRFYFTASGFTFGPHNIYTIEKPVITSFKINLEYPEYTGITNEELLNAGDIRVPEGTKITWNFFCEEVEKLNVLIGDEGYKSEQIRKNIFKFEKDVHNPFEYTVKTHDKNYNKGDSLSYYIEMIPDRYPTIAVEEQRDEVLMSHIFFRGVINDDYGFTDLQFLYRIYDERNDIYDNEDYNRLSVDFDKDLNNQVFYYHFDINDIDIRPGEILEYLFIVKDNDAINGPKKAKSQEFSYQLPTYEEIIAESQKSSEQISEDISRNVDDVRSSYDELESLQKSMLETENVTWDQKEALKEIVKKKEELEKSLKDIKDFKDQSEKRRQQFSPEEERIQKKHEELQKMFEEMLSDELRELYEKIQEEIDKFSREELFEKMDELKFELSDLERRLDRMLELFKQLELEMLLNESITALEKAIEKQEEAIKENIDNKSAEEKLDKQEEVQEMFDLVEDLINNFENKNEALSKPNRLEDTDDMRNQIKDNLQKALEELMKDRGDRAKPHQERSQDNMESLNNILNQMKDNLFYDTMVEDAYALRQLMENLLKSSFNQEELLKNVRTINVNDPKYVEYIQEQRKISNDLRFIEDSLVALAKRQIQIQNYVTREIAQINKNVDLATRDLINRRRHSASNRQQFSMMHINNLILLLDESLQNMMDQLAEQFGEGMDGESGGEGMPSFSNLREMQEQMNNMLEQLQDGMQPMPGESGEGQMSMSEQMARMAAEQQAIREKLQELASEYRSEGKDLGDISEIISDMERLEMDMIRKNINRQTQIRKDRILTRLLEHEKAEKEQGQDEKREGTTAKSYEISNPEEFFEYNREKNREIEMLKSLPPGYNIYYRNLIEKYFLNIDNN